MVQGKKLPAENTHTHDMTQFIYHVDMCTDKFFHGVDLFVLLKQGLQN